MSQTNQEATAPPIQIEDVELLAALGLASPDLSSFEVFLLAGKIIRNQTVLKRKVWKVDGTFRGEMLDSLEVIEEMTDAERNALRERVLTPRG
jgi:hypothetical protein